MNKAERIATFDSGSTHAMTLTAVDLDENGQPKKWKVENSWSASYGQNGYLIMSNPWFNEYTFRLVVDNKYVPENILRLPSRSLSWLCLRTHCSKRTCNAPPYYEGGGG